MRWSGSGGTSFFLGICPRMRGLLLPKILGLVLLGTPLFLRSTSAHLCPPTGTMGRNEFGRHLATRWTALGWLMGLSQPSSVQSMTISSQPSHTVPFTATTNNAFIPSDHHDPRDMIANGAKTEQGRPVAVAYKSLSLVLEDFDNLRVPVAGWFPCYDSVGATSTAHSLEELLSRASSPTPAVSTTTSSIKGRKLASYEHRISVAKIGQLLADWHFIPEFATRRFALTPTMQYVVDGQSLSLPNTHQPVPVILLAHGFLGSRFDLAHLAEYLAMEGGFVCLAAEYPESLSASYEAVPTRRQQQKQAQPQPWGRFDPSRATITQSLLSAVEHVWDIQVSAYGVVGHSLGCGTALEIGDHHWARVCLAGFPPSQPSRGYQSVQEKNALYICSMNDGLVARFGGIPNLPSDVTALDESILRAAAATTTSSSSSSPRENTTKIPSRSILVLDGPKAPNHISFLSENVNDAMIHFLSPLLPLAQALDIPVLDFDKYRESRDSFDTAKMLHPLILRYLQQELQQ